MILKKPKDPDLRFSASLIIIAALLASSVVMLGSDSLPFIVWWAACIVTAAVVWPFVSRLFSAFDDRGWLFSKVIGIAVPGYITWALTCFHIISFTTAACVIIVLITAVVSWVPCFFRGRTRERSLLYADWDLIVLEEAVFLAAFLMWTYFSGFRPEALTTEKFMDFGFMAAMVRDTTLPAMDIWYAGETINYYYGGQYFGAFLTKLTSTDVDVTYNIMRALVGGFAFALPFSLTRQAFKMRKGHEDRRELLPCIVGAFAGAGVSLAGNMHYVLYGLFGKVLRPSGYEDYWFPSSTRYIGHNPETMDKTIHEFPSYSMVLGDLHAHMVNLILVITFMAVIFAWFLKNERLRAELTGTGRFRNKAVSDDVPYVFKEEAGGADDVRNALKEALADPFIWAIGFFLGMFQWTNYWDFIIYLTVFIISDVLIMIRRIGAGGDTAGSALVFVIRMAAAAAFSMLAALPFNMTFKTMVSGVALCVEHSALYQLVILWGLPVVCVIVLFIFTCVHVRDAHGNVSDSSFSDDDVFDGADGTARRKVMKGYVNRLTIADMFMVMIGCCAIGLIIIPELVYVRDIYEGGFSRSNTMFKLTYQAYIMFGMSMIYGIFRVLADAARKAAKIIAAVLLFLFILTLGYFPYSLKCWFGNVLDISEYRMLSSTAYLINEMPKDADAIYWLADNVEGIHTVLEAYGDSYTTSCRVSAMTGLPTVVGWATHEWLWRGDLEAQYARCDDVDLLYTSADEDVVKELIEKYDIEYIFVGSCEREKYEDLNEGLLLTLGEVVFTDRTGEQPAAYIIKV